MAVNHGLYIGIISRHLRHTMSNVFRQSWVFVDGTMHSTNRLIPTYLRIMLVYNMPAQALL